MKYHQPWLALLLLTTPTIAQQVEFTDIFAPPEPDGVQLEYYFAIGEAVAISAEWAFIGGPRLSSGGR